MTPRRDDQPVRIVRRGVALRISLPPVCGIANVDDIVMNTDG